MGGARGKGWSGGNAAGRASSVGSMGESSSPTPAAGELAASVVSRDEQVCAWLPGDGPEPGTKRAFENLWTAKGVGGGTWPGRYAG